MDRSADKRLHQKDMGPGYKLENSPALVSQNPVIFFHGLVLTVRRTTEKTQSYTEKNISVFLSVTFQYYT